jgi:hypothetical protein
VPQKRGNIDNSSGVMLGSSIATCEDVDKMPRILTDSAQTDSSDEERTKDEVLVNNVTLFDSFKRKRK